MHSVLAAGGGDVLAAFDLGVWSNNIFQFVKVLIGFSIIIFVHELGHFLVAKWVGVRVDRFAIGFGTRLIGWRRGEGVTLGNRPNYTADEIKEKRYGETDYCFKALPLGGYVKMLGQDDIQINEDTGEITLTDDPRAFTNRSVRQRMMVISAGVIMNVAFAALAYMVVFLIGIEMYAPVIGALRPGSAAAQAGLLEGDWIESVNGTKANTMEDVVMAGALSDQPVQLKIVRDGVLLDRIFALEPTWDERDKFYRLDLPPLVANRMAVDFSAPADGIDLKRDDRIVEVGGTAVSEATRIMRPFQLGGGKPVEIVVERGDEEAPDRITMTVVPSLLNDLREIKADGTAYAPQDNHILGAIQRRRVRHVEKGAPADKAGFKPGDVIASWGTVSSPTSREIIDNILSNARKPTRVIVEREGQQVELNVIPTKPFQLFGTSRAKVGIDFTPYEMARPVVADVLPNTPVAEVGMPRGSMFETVAGVEVHTWFDVIQAWRKHAGQRVSVTYRTGEQSISAEMSIPSSMVNELGLPPDAIITEIDGLTETRIETRDRNGQTLRQTVSVRGINAIELLLRERIGKTIVIKYTDSSGNTYAPAKLSVRDDNIFLWQMRMNYVPPFVAYFQPVRHRVHAHGNPALAMWMGVELTFNKVMELYRTLKQLAKRNVSVQHMSGPVGIIRIGISIAEQGFVELVFFLAFLSLNLAVINFLPLPVVDGGLMVFLIIEKIKGKPLSIQTQMVSTIVGLALIVLVFLFVTVQDIVKLF